MIEKLFPAFRSAVTLGAVLSTALVFTGCNSGEEESGSTPEPEATGEPGEAPAEAAPEAAAAPEETAPEAAAPAAVAAAPTTGLTGTIKFEGEVPAPSELSTKGDAKCAVHDNTIIFSKVQVGDGGGLANVFIKIKNPPEAEYTPPATPAVLDQVGCMYTPHVMGIQVGQDLEVRNSDATTHNVRAIARKNRPINMGQPAGSKPRVKTFKREESITIKCDIHKWMTGYVHVVSHPYWAVTDENGAFTISGLPAGEYKYEAVHESLKKLKGDVVIDANGNATLDLAYSE